MAELNCRLSPLVFAELYRLLLEGDVRDDDLGARLAELRYDIDWFQTAADAYDAKWREAAQWGPDAIEDNALDPEHAVVATWILAGLRNTGHSLDLSGDLRERIAIRAEEEVPGLELPLPAALTPVVIGWTLGKVAGFVDGSLPVVPAVPHEDEQINAAYMGLVEHVANLPSATHEYPELTGSATFVRSAGLAEALADLGEDGTQQKAVNKLMLDSRSQAPEYVLTRLRSTWERDFVKRRNVLTHVRGRDGLTFTDAVDGTRTWSHLEQTVAGITQFVCQAISLQLYDAMPPAVHGDPWTKFVERDLKVWI